jgi:hypothetical protein
MNARLNPQYAAFHVQLLPDHQSAERRQETELRGAVAAVGGRSIAEVPRGFETKAKPREG